MGHSGPRRWTSSGWEDELQNCRMELEEITSKKRTGNRGKPWNPVWIVFMLLTQAELWIVETPRNWTEAENWGGSGSLRQWLTLTSLCALRSAAKFKELHEQGPAADYLILGPWHWTCGE